MIKRADYTLLFLFLINLLLFLLNYIDVLTKYQKGAILWDVEK
jgi:hypothetical protein